MVLDPVRLQREAAARLAAAGVERPAFEAQLLLAHALGATRLEVLRGLGRDLSRDEASRYDALVARRTLREPFAYVKGSQEFYGLEFAVTPHVLVPRPETELLVDLAREKLSGRGACAIADVGTGSGCIAVATAVHLPDARVLALDVSAAALGVAAANAERLAVADRVLPVRSDLLSCVAGGALDIVLANPPYIPTAEVEALQPEVRDHEPRLALDGGPDGLELVRRLLEQARRALAPGGWLGIEVAMGQAGAVAELAERAGFTDVALRRDLAGIERTVVAEWPGAAGGDGAKGER